MKHHIDAKGESGAIVGADRQLRLGDVAFDWHHFGQVIRSLFAQSVKQLKIRFN